jgi:hypothetical protein
MKVLGCASCCVRVALALGAHRCAGGGEPVCVVRSSRASKHGCLASLQVRQAHPGWLVGWLVGWLAPHWPHRHTQAAVSCRRCCCPGCGLLCEPTIALDHVCVYFLVAVYVGAPRGKQSGKVLIGTVVLTMSSQKHWCLGWDRCQLLQLCLTERTAQQHQCCSWCWSAWCFVAVRTCMQYQCLRVR